MENRPDWLTQSEALEREDRLIEAEDIIRNAVPHQGFAISIAEMYRRRMLHLSADGDSAGAAEARQKASDWAYFYASQATSGGEGLALSAERDEFLQGL
jgi:hypothetical protein